VSLGYGSRGLWGGGSTGGGGGGITATLSRISSTVLRVTFSAAVEDNVVLRSVSSYRVYDDAEVAPDLAVSAVTPEAVGSPTYVDLTCDEQRTGVSYRVKVYRIG